MSLLFNLYKNNMIIMNSNYDKIKINFFFLNYTYIIFLNDYNHNLKHFFLNNNAVSIVLKGKYIKTLFSLLNFSFLRNSSYLCIFINDKNAFLNIANILFNKSIYYSYKKNISNLIIGSNLIEDYKKYKNNYFYIFFFIKKMKIKIIVLLIFFYLSLVKILK